MAQSQAVGPNERPHRWVSTGVKSWEGMRHDTPTRQTTHFVSDLKSRPSFQDLVDTVTVLAHGSRSQVARVRRSTDMVTDTTESGGADGDASMSTQMKSSGGSGRDNLESQ